MSRVEDIRGKIPPEVEERLDRAVKTFRSNHKHPANLALHAAGYYAILKGLRRFASGKRFRAVVLIGFGLAMLLWGHDIEGTEAFAILKRGNGHVG